MTKTNGTTSRSRQILHKHIGDNQKLLPGAVPLLRSLQQPLLERHMENFEMVRMEAKVEGNDKREVCLPMLMNTLH